MLTAMNFEIWNIDVTLPLTYIYTYTHIPRITAHMRAASNALER